MQQCAADTAFLSEKKMPETRLKAADSPPPIPPQTAEQLRAGLGTPADPLHYVSGGGGDSQSVGTSASGGERRRGRPRNLVEPVGASLTLNV